MNKRNIVILCLLTVLLLTPFSACAENFMTNAGHGMTGTTVVRLVIPSSFIVEIPAELSIPYGVESTPMTIGVSSVKIGSEQVVKIAVDSARSKLLQNGGKSEIPFVLRVDGEEFSDAQYSKADQTQLSVDIALEDWYNADAGEYAGAVTFRVSVEDQEVTQ